MRAWPIIIKFQSIVRTVFTKVIQPYASLTSSVTQALGVINNHLRKIDDVIAPASIMKNGDILQARSFEGKQMYLLNS